MLTEQHARSYDNVALGAFMLHAEAAPNSFSPQALAQHFTTDVMGYVQQPGHLTEGVLAPRQCARPTLPWGTNMQSPSLPCPLMNSDKALKHSCCDRAAFYATGGLFWQTDISPWFSNRAGLSAGLTSLMYIDMFSPDATTAAWLSTFAQSQLDYVRNAPGCCCIDGKQLFVGLR